MIFACYNYFEEKNVRLVVMKFSNYALICWDELVKSRRRNREHPIETWDEIKRIMKKRFIPSHYKKCTKNYTGSLKAPSQ